MTESTVKTGLKPEEYKGADPRLIVAVQMTSIGVVLDILGLTVALLTPYGKMAPFMRLCTFISYGSILLVGLGFTIGGIVRLRHRQKA